MSCRILIVFLIGVALAGRPIISYGQLYPYLPIGDLLRLDYNDSVVDNNYPVDHLAKVSNHAGDRIIMAGSEYLHNNSIAAFGFLPMSIYSTTAKRNQENRRSYNRTLPNTTSCYPRLHRSFQIADTQHSHATFNQQALMFYHSPELISVVDYFNPEHCSSLRLFDTFTHYTYSIVQTEPELIAQNKVVFPAMINLINHTMARKGMHEFLVASAKPGNNAGVGVMDIYLWKCSAYEVTLLDSFVLSLENYFPDSIKTPILGFTNFSMRMANSGKYLLISTNGSSEPEYAWRLLLKLNLDDASSHINNVEVVERHIKHSPHFRTINIYGLDTTIYSDKISDFPWGQEYNLEISSNDSFAFSIWLANSHHSYQVEFWNNRTELEDIFIKRNHLFADQPNTYDSFSIQSFITADSDPYEIRNIALTKVPSGNLMLIEQSDKIDTLYNSIPNRWWDEGNPQNWQRIPYLHRISDLTKPAITFEKDYFTYQRRRPWSTFFGEYQVYRCFGDLIIPPGRNCAIPVPSSTRFYAPGNTSHPSTSDSKHPNPLRVFDYLRISHKVSYTCAANIEFKNNSLRDLGLDEFTWIIQNEAGTLDTLYGREVSVPRNQKGKYAYTVYANSSKTGYQEWWHDTVRVDYDFHKHARFNFKDTLICQYESIHFDNESDFGFVPEESGLKYFWEFGDGETSTAENPVHIFNKPGVYQVRLSVSNGFCDTFFVHPQTITVVGGPKSGFTVDNNHGCTPLTTQVTDTIAHNVYGREYFFSDLNKWKEVEIPTFSHTFEQAGEHFIIQRLFGAPGCIVQRDTHFFTVKPGFTSTDTLHIRRATFQDNEHILLEWPAMPHAEAYQLHKSDGPVTTDQTAYTHPIAAPALFEYRLQALDSCGNSGGMSAVERPVLLQGEVIGKNEAALLRFSPYLGQDELQYRILRDGSPLSGFAIPDTDLRDEDYKSGGGLQACFLVEATSTDQWLSRSNTLCLPYIPALFLPNAFSPNGDGLNDVFAPSTFGITEYSLSIYNRWGERIHQGKTWNGQNALPGAYFYTLEATDNQGKRIFLKGSVSVVE